jgi:hypothetical protein
MNSVQSAIRNPQSAILSLPPPGWLPLAEAALHLGVSRDTARRRCQAGKLSAVQAETAFGPAWYVNPEAIPSLHIIQGDVPAPRPECTESLARLSGAKRETVLGKLAAVEAYRQALARRDLGASEKDVRRNFTAIWNGTGRTPHLSPRSLERWEKHYRAGGVAALVDQRRWHGEVKWSPEGIEFIEGLWLCEGSQGLRSHYARAEALASREGWKLPTYRHVCRLMAQLDRKLKAAGRDPREFRDRCLPYALRDWSLVPAMHCWIADHRIFDVLVPRQVTDEKTGKTRWLWRRPWITCFMDARSWMPVAWSISWEAPDGNRTMSTFVHGVRTHGKPGVAYLDNGKDFRMAKFSGGRPRYQSGKAEYGQLLDARESRSIMELLGVQAIFALPYNAKAKTIEPFFRLMAEGFDKTWATYCGPSTERKPECLKDALAKGAETWAVKFGLTLEGFSGAFTTWVNEVYGLAESPAEAAKPLSALRAFEELRAPDFTPMRPSDEDLSMLLLPSKPVCVGPNGLTVTIPGDRDCPATHRHYWHEALENRRAASGRDLRLKVTYRYNPDDLSRVWVFDAVTGKYLCEAKPYIGEACHPLARSEADRDQIGAVMALRRGLEKRTYATLHAKQEFATNLLLSSAAGAARSLGRLDDPATIPQPGPPVLQMTEVSAAAAARQRSGEVTKWQSDEVTENGENGTTPSLRHSVTPPLPLADVGASAIDELPDEPATTKKEHGHDCDDGKAAGNREPGTGN